MADSDYTIDLRTRSPVWARLLSTIFGGTLTTPEKGSQLGRQSASGMVGQSSVTDERAMQISAVWACVRIITAVTASLPLDVYVRKNGVREKADLTHPLARLLKYRPNQYMTALEFREAMTMQLCFYGNSYALIERNKAGDIISLLPMKSANMDVKLDDKGELVYEYKRDGKMARFKHHEIFHLKGFGFTGLTGLSPIAFATQSVGVSVAMEDQQREFYANGAKQPKILTTGNAVLTKEQRAQVEQNFEEISSGPVRKRLWVLEAGFDTKDIGISPQDAETLAARKFQVAEIARFFGGIPPHLIGDMEKSTSWGSGIEQQNLGFLQYVLTPYLSRWEEAIWRWLVPSSEIDNLHAEHNIEGLLRGDSASRADFMTKLVGNGLMTINEARKLDNRPPLEGGDVATRQMQNVPINQPTQPNPAQSGV